MNATFLLLLLASSTVLVAPPVSAAGAERGHKSGYAGQEQRAIKSLSPADIEELRRGGGWGFAKAAELNGVPGPAHLLEMREDIGLDEGQVRRITALYERMQAQAVAGGEMLIERERALDAAFASGTPTPEALQTLVESIAKARGQLRLVHLSAHLETPAILTPVQIAAYNALRGYMSDDPCASVPEGHDASKWRRHNGCE